MAGEKGRAQQDVAEASEKRDRGTSALELELRALRDELERTERALAEANERAREAQAEAAVQSAQLRGLLDHLPAAINVIRGPELRYEFVNRASRRLLGTAHRLEGHTVSEVFPELAPHIRDTLERVIATGERFSSPEVKVSLDFEGNGVVTERYFDVLYEPLRDVRGKIEGLVAVGYDITQLVAARHEAQLINRQLAASEARARRLQDCGVIGVVFWTRDGRLVDANDAFLKMVDYDREDLAQGRVRWTQMTPPEFAPLDERAFVEMERDGICQPYEKEYIAKDGRRVPIALGVAFWENRTDGGVAWILDISAKKQAEREREAALARERGFRLQAEQAGKAKDEFLSTLSHELRTPLSAILGWAQVLRSGKLGSERAAQALETIERNARMQARLIEDMLDLSRIVQGKLVLSVGPLELGRVIDAALDAVRPSADAKSIRLQAVLDSHASIVGDADRLQQVVWNLLSNAIKFTPKGGRVLIELTRERSYVQLRVSDNGQGIAPEFLPHVFERFRQADGSMARQAGGLGLGLAIVRSLVEMHGGTVSAHSEGAGQGALFVVQLPTAPVRATPDAEQTDGAPRERTFEGPPGLCGKRVLVLDDEADTRRLLAYLLEGCECAVTPVQSADAARTALATGAFDVIVSDVGMPGEDGYAFIQSVRKLPAAAGGRTPALALTAYARAEDRTQALKSGFNAHLAKPIDPQELLVVVAHLVGAYAPGA